MTHEQIINEANTKGFKIVVLNEVLPDINIVGTLAGTKLAFPVAYNTKSHIECEISWALAERIATGQTNEIYL